MFTSALRNAIAGPSRPTFTPNLTVGRPMLIPITRVSRSALPCSAFLTRSFSVSAPASDKLKSHSGTKKRFFRTASGLFKRAQAGKAHLNTMFSAKRINRLGKTAYTTKTQAKMLRKLLPYA